MRGRTRTRGAALLAGLALAGAGWSPAAAQDSRVADEAIAWLERALGARPLRIIDLSDTRLVVLMKVEPRPPSDWRLGVHVETFGPASPFIPASSDLEVFVNCPSRRYHVERIENFTENGDRGAQATSFGASDWTQPALGSVEARIVTAACGPAMIAEAAPVPAAQPPATRTAAPAAPPAPPPPPAPKPAAPQPTPAPKPPAASPPALAMATATGTGTTTATVTTIGAGAAGGPARVQLFAGATRDIAERFLAAAPERTPMVRGRPLGVEPARVGGRTVYRVVVGGLASEAAAAGLCAEIRSAGQDCFIRR